MTVSKIRHITLPKGFLAAGVTCGLKRSGKEDLAILAAEADAACALLTTTNQVVGEPVRWCRKVLPKGYGTARGIVINSGCSNVCTGAAGLRDAEEMAARTAKLLKTAKGKVLVASTGIIGHRLPMAKVRRGIAAAAAKLGTKHDAAALRAIMTTDTREKSAVVQMRIGGETVTVAGIAKGSGMVAPSLATMIAVLTTDAKVSAALLHKALKAAAGESFNAVTVDSDTSTSDTLAIFASAQAGPSIRAASAAWRTFAAAVAKVCAELARAVVADGEGATKVIEIAVRGARSDREAKIAAKSVADSPLMKCAVHGNDPNWGRVLVALGKSAARIDPARTQVTLCGVKVFSRGLPRKFNAAALSRKLTADTVRIECDLGLGQGHFTALTCDLSREYIAINADYHT